MTSLPSAEGALPSCKAANAQTEPLNIIYGFIIILLAVIMAVTVNAAFIGMYQRRHFEFAIYRAIGMSKKEIIGKIVKELIYIDGIAVFLGGGIFFLGLYLFNHLALYPVGKYLRYYHPLALSGALLCIITASNIIIKP